MKKSWSQRAEAGGSKFNLIDDMRKVSKAWLEQAETRLPEVVKDLGEVSIANGAGSTPRESAAAAQTQQQRQEFLESQAAMLEAIRAGGVHKDKGAQDSYTPKGKGRGKGGQEGNGSSNHNNGNSHQSATNHRSDNDNNGMGAAKRGRE